MAKILLVDDEELVIKSLEKLLKKEGHDITAAHNGSEAIKKAESMDFDLIITDLRMPTLNGIDTIEQIRKVVRMRGGTPAPEICITGYADEEINKKAEKIGVADYLYKPFDLRDFLSCVKKHLKD